MSDPTSFAAGLEADLRSYFAATTAVEMPRGVRSLSASRVRHGDRRGLWWLPASAGALAAAAVGLILILRPVTHLGGESLSMGGANSGAGAGASKSLATLAYPGVDTAALAASGVSLLPAASDARVAVPAHAAQTVAAESLGTRAGAPGPALLAQVRLHHLQPPSCLCWAVDVPVTGGLSTGTAGDHADTELVLVDATSGRVVATLAGNGIP